MGATWAFALVWFPQKWDYTKFQEAVGVKSPLWVDNFDPKFGFSATEGLEARQVIEEVLSVQGHQAKNTARKHFGPTTLSKVSGVRRTIAAYLNEVTNGRNQAFKLPKIVAAVLRSKGVSAVEWARNINQRSLVSSISFA